MQSGFSQLTSKITSNEQTIFYFVLLTCKTVGKFLSLLCVTAPIVITTLIRVSIWRQVAVKKMKQCSKKKRLLRFQRAAVLGCGNEKLPELPFLNSRGTKIISHLVAVCSSSSSSNVDSSSWSDR
jgi:hypothetical protein